MNSIESLIFYLLTFAVASVLVGYGIKKKSRLFAWLGLLIPILVGGFRYAVGTDYFNYVTIFSEQARLDFVDYVGQNGIAEIGFFALNKLSSVVMSDPRLMFLISAFLVVTFFYLGLVKYKLRHPGIVFFLFLTTIFPMMLNTVRQGIAVSIVFYAMTFILSKKFVSFFLWILVASLFHISALLIIPFYFLGTLLDVEKRKYLLAKSRYFLGLGAASIILLVVVANVFTLVLGIPGFDKYELYLDFNEESANNIFFVKLVILIFIVVLARYTIFTNNYRQNAFFLLAAITEIIFLILGFTSPFIKREALYFAPFALMLLPNVIYAFKGRGLQVIVKSLVVCYGIIFFIISYLILDQAAILPYSFSLLGGS